MWKTIAELRFASKAEHDAVVHALELIADAIKTGGTLDIRTDEADEKNHWLLTVKQLT